MTAAGKCSTCGALTDRYVEGTGWWCRACDPLADYLKKQPKRMPKPEAPR